jgi:predicted transcriptional regulator
MNDSILIAKELAAKLGERRTSTLENELSKIFRELSEEQQLEIISQLLQDNVRVAAAVAVRGGISVAQQILLLQLLLKSGQTNTLKVMVHDVFAHRLGAEVFAHSLEKHRSQYPASVNLAAYYFLGAGKMSSKTRGVLQSLLEATRPMA